MIRTSYLRVYQPLEAFAPEEAARWRVAPEAWGGHDAGASHKWLIGGVLPLDDALAPTEGAFVRRVGGKVLVCPWRTRLRMLAGLLAFRRSIPEEVAEAFVPGGQAAVAGRELEALGRRYPDMRSHILQANWHVPLRWFVAFDDSERILTEDSSGLRIRYEAPLRVARARVERALGVLEGSWIDDGVVEALRELFEWLEEFPGDGLLELDYASVAGLFDDEDLLEDRSAGDVWSCLEALESGDLVRAGRVFGSLTDRWAEVRTQEALN
jgi:hypothetical protein